MGESRAIVPEYKLWKAGAEHFMYEPFFQQDFKKFRLTTEWKILKQTYCAFLFFFFSVSS